MAVSAKHLAVFTINEKKPCCYNMMLSSPVTGAILKEGIKLKKVFTLALIIALALSLLTACGGGENSGGNSGGNKDTESSDSGAGRSLGGTSSSSGTEQVDQARGAASAANGQETARASVPDTKKLDDFKKAVGDAGCEIVEMMDISKIGNSIDGFMFDYKDTYIPVYEFKSAEDARAEADKINEAGYNVAVVNGRFMSMVGAKAGVVKDLDEQRTVETIMGVSAEDSTYAPKAEAAAATTDYKSAAGLILEIGEAMNAFYDQIATKHGQTHKSGDPGSVDNVIVNMLDSMGLAITSGFCEDQVMLDAIQTMLTGYLGYTKAEIARNAPNNYILNATGGNGISSEYNGIYDPGTGSLKMTNTEGGKIVEFVEFVPLGGNKYAYRSERQKAVVEYSAGRILSFAFASNNQAGDYSADVIYPSGNGADESWVTRGGPESYDQCIIFDGAKVSVNARPVYGSRVVVEIPV